MKTTKETQKTFQKRNFYTVRDSSNVFFLALIFAFAFSLIFSLGFTQIMHGIDPNFKLENSEGTTVYLIVQLVSAILTQVVFLCVYLCYHTIQRISFSASNVHIKKTSPWQAIIWGLLGVICVLGFVCLIEGCFGHLFSVMGLKSSSQLKIGNVGNYFIYIIFLGLLPAIIEELLFRGVIYQGLKEYFSLPARVLLCGFLFALMHTNIMQFIYPFVLGCTLSLVMEKTNNLVYTMLFHFFNNFTTITMTFIMEMYNFSFDKIPISWWFVLLSIALALVTSAIIYLVLRFVRCKKVEVEKQGDDQLKPLALFGKFPVLLLCGVVFAIVMIVINALV